MTTAKRWSKALLYTLPMILTKTLIEILRLLYEVLLYCCQYVYYGVRFGDWSL